MSRVPTWFWEQALLFALVVNATAWQVGRMGGVSALTARDAILLALSAALVMAAQKVRSMADRQRERNEAEGVVDAPMSCSPRVALWSLVSQALGLCVGVATAPSWAHVLVALFVAGYVPVWRKRIYRRVWPSRVDRPLPRVVPVGDVILDAGDGPLTRRPADLPAPLGALLDRCERRRLLGSGDPGAAADLARRQALIADAIANPLPRGFIPKELRLAIQQEAAEREEQRRAHLAYVARVLGGKKP